MKFDDIDSKLIVFFDGVAGYLQENMGLTMAIILREIAMGAVFANALLFFSFWKSGSYLYIAVYLPFASACIVEMIRDYKKHNANSGKEWTESVARKYLVAADVKRTAYGTQRCIIIVLASFIVAMTMMSNDGLMQLDNFAVLLTFGIIMAREYIGCAHPRPPGSRSDSLNFGGRAKGSRVAWSDARCDYGTDTMTPRI